jgi:hypothetical protein
MNKAMLRSECAVFGRICGKNEERGRGKLPQLHKSSTKVYLVRDKQYNQLRYVNKKQKHRFCY